MNLPQLPADKANHMLTGAVIALAIGFLFGSLVGLLAAVAAGALKEASDYVLNRRAIAAGLPPPHGVELNDFLATAAGGLLIFLARLH